MYFVQVTLGSNFVDLYVDANTAEDAIAAARAEVAAREDLKLFRHRFANYIAG